MTIAALVLGLIVLCGTIFWVYSRGRSGGRASERIKMAEKADEVREEQLKAAANRPRDRDELARRLRDDEF